MNDVILIELRGMRQDLNAGFMDTKQRLTAIETQTEPFFETAGGLQQLHENLDSLKRTQYYALGGVGVLTTLGHWLLRKFNW